MSARGFLSASLAALTLMFYGLIAAMAATSTDAAVKLLGQHRWRAFANPSHVAPAALLGAALVVWLLPSRPRVS